MNLDFSPEEIAFRNEVREFIRENLRVSGRVRILRAKNSSPGTKCSVKRGGQHLHGLKNTAAPAGPLPSAISGRKRMLALMR